MNSTVSDWRKAAVFADFTIRQTLQVINQSAVKVALVVDQDDTLLGIVTDGDIRRALLNNIEMTAPVSEVMNRKPITAKASTSDRQIKQWMDKGHLLVVPVVTESNKVMKLVSLHQLVGKKTHDNAVLLMAGGFGKRLSPLTNDCPKPLLKVGEKPILEITLKNFADAGFSTFYISTHYMPEKIRRYFGDGSRWGVNIEYLHEEQPLGTAGALSLLPEQAKRKDVIVMNGDILTNVDVNKLLAFHQDNQADATMCVREYVSQIPYGVIETDGYKITQIKEKPSYQHFVNAGIYVVSKRVLDSLSVGQRIDMTTLLEDCIADKGSVSVYPILDYWLDIGHLDDFRQAQTDIKALT
ncbi:nucleotidyltransferase family protein [Aestuariibacter halophilus]|uniref:Nucleotidyltransferase family protein n=1 Tax=Fluctibacter halophilus TaxID=226011 RepID=A0ABS8G3F6_9ALTE|nr:nucleotidyltransferase family protein [Aestuariibacter halophilus]MCC2615132.1 nucleotidyltransferase family protein [Aestuariibacter halophilus]